MFNWYREVSADERKTFWGCFGGWALDALDVQMLGLIIPSVITAFAISKTQAGLISSVTLFSGAFGGWLMGAVSDRIGRVKALQVTILWFSVFTFLSAFAQDYWQFIVLKALQGFGFGGEWAAGSVLLAEIIRSEHRGKAMSATQSAWSVGWGAAVLLYAAAFSCLPAEIAWRAMLAIGLLPALLIIYVRRHIKEPKLGAISREKTASKSWGHLLLDIFSPATLRVTIIGGFMGMGAHGGYAVLSTWLATYLKTERHLSVLGTSGYLAVLIFAFWVGYITVGYLLDKLGRRPTVTLFAFCCTLSVILYTLIPLTDSQMLYMGFPLGFFAAGIPGSMGALFSELYPAGMRGNGVGFCYNFGRILSAVFPALVGYMAGLTSLGTSIGIAAAAGYGVVVLSVLALPETRGKKFEAEGAAEPAK